MKEILPFSFKSIWLRRGYAAVLFCLILPLSAFAQSDTTKKLKEVNVNTDAIPVTPVIVLSQSISSNDFIHYNAFNVADAIRDFSGVIIKDYGGVGGLKTVSVRGLSANHTSVFFDGIQINDAENGQVDLGRLNLSNISKISLYSGQPPVLLQTARAFAAASVLSVEPIKPELTASKTYQVTAGLKTGSFGLVNPYLVWQQRINDKWAFTLNGFTDNANGKYKYTVDYGAQTVNRTRIGTNVAAQQIDGALYFNNDNSHFNLRVDYYNADRGVPGADIYYTDPPTGQRLYNRDLFLQGYYQYNWKNGLQLLVNSKFAQNQLHYFDPQFSNSAGFLDQHFSQREYYQSAAISYPIKSNWEVSYASDFALNNMNADLGTFKYPTRLTLLNVIATKLTLGNTILQGSLLNTDVGESVKTGTSTPHRNKFSPTIMATIKPFSDQNFNIRAFYKSIFRLPTFDDQYYGFVSNPNLKPELVDEYDLGAAYTKSLSGVFDYVTLTADGYYNKVTNMIVFMPAAAPGPAQNYGKVDIEGLDVSLKTQARFATSKVSLSANYSYQNAENVTDPALSTYLNQMPYIPKNTLAINAGLNKGRFGIYYNQTILSTRFYTGNNTPDDALPPYAIGDGSVVYRGLVNHFPVMLSAEINNVFNKNYVVVRSYPMPGRSYRFTFQITI